MKSPAADSVSLVAVALAATASTAMVIEVRPCLIELGVDRNLVADRDRAGKLDCVGRDHHRLALGCRRDARLRAASAIWLISQPPNTPP